MIATRLPPWPWGFMRESMCWRKRSCPSLIRGRPAPKRPRSPRPDGGFVHLPLLAVGRVGQEVVEAAVRVLVVGEGAAELDVLRVQAPGTGEEQVRLADGKGLRVHLLAEHVDLRQGVDLPDAVPGDGEHPAGPGAGVVDGADDVVLGEDLPVLRQQEVNHQADHLAGGEVLAGVLVQGFVELADQLLEDVAHLQVAHAVRVEVDVLEPLQDQEEQPGLVQLGDGVLEVELLQHFPQVVAEPGDVEAQVRRQVGRVVQQLLEVEGGGIVDREAGGPPEDGVQVLQPPLHLEVRLHHLRLRRGQHGVDAPEDRQRQDHVLVLGAAEGVPEQVRNTPDEGGLFLEVDHGVVRVCPCRWLSVIPGGSMPAKRL
jgi:hypothetical protein